MDAGQPSDHQQTSAEQERRESQDAEPQAALAATFRAIGLALHARQAHSATIAVDAAGACIVVALPPGTAPPSWPVTILPGDRAQFIEGVEREQQGGGARLVVTGKDDIGWLQRLHAVGRLLDERGSATCTVLVDLERGAVAAADARGPVVPPEAEPLPAARQIFHPGQQARYQKGSAPPCAVTVKRLGKHQIRVAFEDGTEQAIHRKWLTPLDWPLPPSAHADEGRTG